MKEKTAEFLERYQRELKEAAGELRGRPMPPLTEELFSVYEQIGNRLSYEEVYFLRRKYLAVFGMNAVLFRRGEDIEELERVLTQICGETCWALPAHVDRKNDGEWRRTLDLFACETAGALAELCAVLGGALSPDVRREAERQVMERVLEPFERSAVPCGRWELCGHNWNAVCGGSIGIAAICLLSGEPERQRAILERICASLHAYIDGFAEDGACMEGLGYFTYGMSYYMAFAQLLPVELQEKLPGGEKINRIMEFQQKCYFPGGLSVSFSDGSSRERFRMGLSCRMRRLDAAAVLPPMELAAGLSDDPCFRWVMLYRDYVWTREELEGGGTSPDASGGLLTKSHQKDEKERLPYGQTVLPDAQWSICRSPSGAALAAKGGTNGEPHNHNDVGSFHYVLGDEVFLADLGAGEYTKAYFCEETRYDIFVNQSFSHNVPVIDGQPQKAGKSYACGSFAADGAGKTALEFAGAYGNPALKALRRTLDFRMEDGRLEVTDVFEQAGEGLLEIQENLVTPHRPQVRSDKTVLLAGRKNACVLQIETEEEILVQEQTYADHEGRMRSVYLLRWSVPAKGAKAQAHFCILPDAAPTQRACSEIRAENSLPAF